jgi:hypothetical protein
VPTPFSPDELLPRSKKDELTMILMRLRQSLRIEGTTGNRGRSTRRRFRPTALDLEERQLLSTFTWALESGGLFNNPQNWTDQNGHHGVPGAADTAIVKGSGFTVTIDQSTTVGSLICSSQLAIASGALTLDGPGQISSIAALVLNPNTTLAVAKGSLDLTGTSTLASTLAGTLDAASGTAITFTGGRFAWTGGTLAGSGQVIVARGATLGIVTTAASSLQNDAVLINDGSVVWSESYGGIGGAGTIDNYGTFAIVGQSPLQQKYANPIDGTFNNNGLLTVNGALPTIDSLSSRGTIHVTNSGYLTIAGNATLSGVLNADWGTTVSFAGAVNSRGQYVPGVVTAMAGTAFDGPGFYSVWDHETLALETNVSPTSFLVAGGSVTGPGSLTVTGYIQFSAGTIAPAVLGVPSGATFHIDDYYNKSAYGWRLAAGTVNLGGQTDWNTPGALVLGSSTIINNAHGAVLTVECDQSMTGGTLNNQGVLTKVYDPATGTGKGTSRFATSLNNTGSVLVNSGTLNLAGNGTFAGTFNAAAGTSLVFGGGKQDIDGGTVFAGAGAYVLNDGPSGSWVLNTSLNAPNNFSFASGTLDLVGTLSIPGQSAWTGGTLAGPGKLGVNRGGLLKVGRADQGRLVNGAVLVNNGTVVWDPALGGILGGGTIENFGSFQILGHGGGPSEVDGPFTNAGTLIVDDALLTLNSLQSTGAINVIDSGDLTIAGNGRLSGPIQAAQGTSVTFYGTVGAGGSYRVGVVTAEPGASFQGAGSYRVFDGETLALDTGLAPARLQVAGGTVVGTGSLTVTNLLEFDGGAISPAVVNIPAGGTFSIDNAGNAGSYGWILGAGTVNLAGQTVWAVADAGNLEPGSATIINNLPGGALVIQTDNALVGGTLNNWGLIIKTLAPGGWPGYGTTTIVTTLNNAGTVQVNSGMLNLAGPVAQVSGAALTGGSWSVVNGTGAGAVLAISSAGGITSIGPGAWVTLNGLYTAFTNLSSLSVNEGAFLLLGGQSFGTQGSLSNYGLIDLGPGDALGVNGNYGQAPSATLEMTIAGTSASGLVSHLYIAGDAYFGGTLDIYVPPASHRSSMIATF